jgi:RNA polymerase sigma-70 factor (ECF subfamily)
VPIKEDVRFRIETRGAALAMTPSGMKMRPPVLGRETMAIAAGKIDTRRRDTDGRDARLADLMRAAQGGDRRAYATLLRESEPIIRRAAAGAGVHGDRIEDVVQETLLTLHNARQTYDPDRSFTAWLGVIARRRAIDGLRRTGRSDRREVHAPNAYEQHADREANAARGWEDAGRAKDLRAAIAGLSTSQREAVEQLALGEKSLAEAALVTGKSTGALKVNLHRAIKALRDRLARGDDDHV